ncbi:MAG: amidohydrolase family protein [Chloroflexi bacterium]|nr:amidohydrolase family protein [Chloroflexota bacterium]
MSDRHTTTRRLTRTVLLLFVLVLLAVVALGAVSIARDTLSTWARSPFAATAIPPTVAPVPPTATLPVVPADGGLVTGRVDRPGGEAPALSLFFEDTATEAVTVVSLAPGQTDYTAALSAGVYHAYTWLPPDYREKGAYTTDLSHTLGAITVTVGNTFAGVDVTDWYTPAGEPLVLLGTLVDGTGADPVPGAALVIRETRIVAVGPRTLVPVPATTQTFDAPQATLLPGFINTHVHNAYRAANLRAWARAGVTTVRDVGAPAGMPYFTMRDKLRADPRNAWLIASGPLVTVPEGYPIAGNNFTSLTVTSPEDARQKIGKLVDDGADVIKITLTAGVFPTLSPAEAAAIVETAHQGGIPVTVHATNARNLRLALDAGVDDVCHIATDHVPDQDIQRMVDAGVAWVPTFEPLEGRGADNLRRFLQAGGVVALGNDGGYLPGIQIGMPIEEIDWMTKAGMTPMQIIVASTQNAATVCQRQGSLGTLEVGKLADVFVVDGDPLQDLHVLTDVLLVVHHGVIIRMEETE